MGYLAVPLIYPLRSQVLLSKVLNFDPDSYRERTQRKLNNGMKVGNIIVYKTTNHAGSKKR